MVLNMQKPTFDYCCEVYYLINYVKTFWISIAIYVVQDKQAEFACLHHLYLETAIFIKLRDKISFEKMN